MPTRRQLVVGFNVAVVVYQGVAIARFGETVAMRLLGMKVVTANAVTKPGWTASAVRCVTPAALFLLSGVLGGAALALTQLAVYAPVFFGRRQGLHDVAARTLVVRTRA